MQVALVAFSVSLVFLSGQYLKPFWMLVFLSMCLPALEAQQRRQRRRAAEKESAERPLPETEDSFEPAAILGISV
jgi:hypothetical protein